MDWDETSISFYVDDILQVQFDKQLGDTDNEWPFNRLKYFSNLHNLLFKKKIRLNQLRYPNDHRMN
jgi:hypothetical protein